MIIFYNRLCFLPISLFAFLAIKLGGFTGGRQIEAFQPVDASLAKAAAGIQGGSDGQRA